MSKVEYISGAAHFGSGTQLGCSHAFYAAGVIFRSPGSAQRRSREAPPWEAVATAPNTPKVLHKSRREVSPIFCVPPSAYGETWFRHPGCAAAPRPWASKYNRFAVNKSMQPDPTHQPACPDRHSFRPLSTELSACRARRQNQKLRLW